MPRIAHVSLLVSHYDAAIDFFVNALGFDLIEDTAVGGGKRWVVVAPPPHGEMTGASLLLAEATTDEQRAMIGAQGGGRVWLFLHTDDFARDHSRMVAAGVKFAEEPRYEPYGVVAVFEDAWGNRWDLIEPR
jgi:catechol 2,3-dioxygenase-like lactoylglutathione lyase family enzyme